MQGLVEIGQAVREKLVECHQRIFNISLLCHLWKKHDHSFQPEFSPHTYYSCQVMFIMAQEYWRRRLVNTCSNNILSLFFNVTPPLFLWRYPSIEWVGMFISEGCFVLNLKFAEPFLRRTFANIDNFRMYGFSLPSPLGIVRDLA